jgi:hypothetical protein
VKVQKRLLLTLLLDAFARKVIAALYQAVGGKCLASHIWLGLTEDQFAILSSGEL